MTLDERWLTVPEVADVFEASEGAVRQWLKEGILQGYSLPGRRGTWRVLIGSVREVAQSTRAPGRIIARLDEAVERAWAGDVRVNRED